MRKLFWLSQFGRFRIEYVKALLLCILFFGLSSCERDPYADDYTTDEPLTRDVVGSYEFQMQTVADSLNEKYRSEPKPVIVISPNHTFMMHRMPTFKSHTLAVDAGPLTDKLAVENLKVEK